MGAAEVGGGVRIGHERVSRRACVGGGLRISPFEAAVGNGRAIVFEPETVPESTPIAPVQGLQTAMRRTEAELAERLGPEADLVVLDGPLTFLTTSGPLHAWAPGAPSAADEVIAAAEAFVSATTTEVLDHDEGPYLGASYRAEDFLRTWQERLPFGRPLA